VGWSQTRRLRMGRAGERAVSLKRHKRGGILGGGGGGG